MDGNASGTEFGTPGPARAPAIAARLGIAITAAGIAIAASWVVDIRRVGPDWVTMKLLTSICFALAGVQLYTMAAKFGPWVISTLAVGVATACALMLFSALSGIPTILETLARENGDEAILSLRPGVPSLGTLAGFLAASVSSLAWQAGLARVTRWVGIGLFALGGVALLGYAVGEPAWYYYVPERSTAMAFLTAALFCGLGVGHFLEGSSRA